MTPKEALEKLWFHAKEDLRKQDNLYVEYLGDYLQIKQALTELEELKQEIKDRQETEESLGKELIKLGDELEELKRYPTADEVCEALNKWYSEVLDYVFIHGVDDFTYDVDSKRFYKRMLNSPHEMTICKINTNKCIQLREPLSPSLITLIGRFYEGVEKVGKEE